LPAFVVLHCKPCVHHHLRARKSRPLRNQHCDLSITAIRRWMEPSAPISRPCNDGMTGDAAGATKLGLNTATSPSGRGSAASSPATSPPYWVHSHQRSFSNISVESVAPGAITLEDNDNAVDARNKGCWAKSVHIEDYVVINGNRTGIGAFIVWNITVETLRVSQETREVLQASILQCSDCAEYDILQGASFRIRKRFSEFDQLRDRLLQTFPNSQAAMPPLPPKSVISKFRPKFLENRRVGLQYFLK
jgi:hypothetical protein